MVPENITKKGGQSEKEGIYNTKGTNISKYKLELKSLVVFEPKNDRDHIL
jgi:hypothetical protein